MKAVLVFNLNSPDDKERYEYCIKGFKYKLAIEEIFNLLRHEYKYMELTEEKSEYLEYLREKISSLYNETMED